MYILGARALAFVSLLFPCCLASLQWNSILTSTHNLRRNDKLEGQHRHHNLVASSITTRGPLGFREKKRLIGKRSKKSGWSKTFGVHRRLAMLGGYDFRCHSNTLRNSAKRRLPWWSLRGGGTTWYAPSRCAYALPPAGISSLGWDLGMGVVSAAASVLWVKLWTGLARAEKLSPQVSRKIIHTTAAPLFMAMWPFFTSRPSARFFAAGVPLLQVMRLTAAGLSGDKNQEDESSNELVTGISRSGRASEILEGPLKYAIVLTVLTVTGWRSSIVSTVALLQMAVGDGMSDLIGRRFGSHKWRPGGKKSIEGSAAFASGAFAVSMSTIAWYHRAGVLPISPAESVTRVAGVSIACATVELLPKSIVGDDNISVPAVACLIGRFLFGSPAGGGGGV